MNFDQNPLGKLSEPSAETNSEDGLRSAFDKYKNIFEILIRSNQQTKSGGTDGWRTAEAHLFPSISFKAMQRVMEAVAENK